MSSYAQEIWQELFSGTIFKPGRLLLLPNERAFFQYHEEFLTKNEVLIRPRVETFGRLEKKLLEDLALDYVNEWSKSFFLVGLAPDLWPVLSLPGEPDLNRLSDLAGELGDGLDRLRLAGIAWDSVASLEPQLLARTLALAGQKYEAWLGDKFDVAKARLRLLEALREGFEFSALEGVEGIFSTRSQRLSPFEADFLRALASRFKVDLSLEVPSWLLDENLRHNNMAWQRLRIIRDFERDNEKGINLEFCDHQNPMFKDIPASLRYASERLFAPPQKSSEPAPDPEHLCLFVAPTRYHEVEEVARRIKRLLMDGFVPHHLAIAVPDLETYLPAVMDVARRFDLPFFYPRGQSLTLQAPIQSLFDLLSLWGSAWERNRVMRILESPYFDFGLPQNPREALLEAGVTDQRAGGSFEENIVKFLDYGHEKASLLKQVLDIVNKLKESEEKLSGAGHWPEFLEGFKNVLSCFGWPYFGDISGTFDSKLHNDYLLRLKDDKRAIDLFWHHFEQLQQALVLSPEAPEVSITAFRLWLAKALASVRLASVDTSPGKVLVLKYVDLHGASFDSIFMLGLCEKVFPSARAEAVWWPRSFIDNLAKTSLGRPLWTGAAEKYQEDEEIVAAALAQGREVTLSWYKTSDDGRPVLPSALIDSLKDLWPENLIKETVIPWPLPPEVSRVCEAGEMWLNLARRFGDLPKVARVLDLPGQTAQSVWDSLVARRKVDTFDLLPEEVMEAWVDSLRPVNDAPPLLSIYPLSNYAQCPRKFWYAQILGLESGPGELEEWPAFDQGIVMHRVLQKFFEQLKPKMKKKPDLSADKIKILFEEILYESGSRKPVGRAPLWQENAHKLLDRLLKWHRRQENLEKTRVVDLEWAFGNRGQGQKGSEKIFELVINSSPEPFGLTGRIDRIDLTGQNDPYYLVKDYKLRYNKRFDPPKDDKIPINHLALIMYKLAVERHFGQKAHAEFEFIDNKNKKDIVGVAPGGEEMLSSIWTLLRSLKLDRTSDPENCKYCDFYRHCRGQNGQETGEEGNVDGL